ncbi:MAG: alkaline phosphatase family protein [Parafilimonas sp.]|nr:alkaline phosphatase family protein [Parafilimonas sp.]
MKYKFSVLAAVLFFFSFSYAQIPGDSLKRPKLVVGIVIDQMRWDYLYKFYDLYAGDGGFKRLLNQGFSCDNTFIPYTPTVTAAGHASIYTGSVPAIDGIVGNIWFDKPQNKIVYCADDDSTKTIGANDASGKMSPRNLQVTTITDELKLATNFASKVVGISIKDRAAVFPAGHLANAAYWYDSENGNFISSSYYMSDLPRWIKDFNKRKLTDSLYGLNWDLSLPAKVYSKYAGNDEEPYERLPFGNDQKRFPYILNGFIKNDYSKIAVTPYGNNLLEALAEATIVNENLGKNNSTDFLAVSFSSPDYIGHTFGSESWEQLDDYIKLDKTLGNFLSFLDAQIGNGNYIIFLTADHGVANSPGFSQMHKLPGGTFNENSFMNAMKQLMVVKYGSADIVKGMYEEQLLLNDEKIDSLHLNKDVIIETIINAAEQRAGVARAISIKSLSNTTLNSTEKQMLSNTYFPMRSGDIQIVLQPGYVAGDGLGTSHGLWNPYDAHIPLLWYGWNIKPGSTKREIYMTDIAATVAALLHIQMPSGCVGKVIPEVFAQ